MGLAAVIAITNALFSDVLRSAKHLLSLINEILDLSKVEAGKLSLIFSDVSIRSLLDQSLEIVKEKIKEHRLEASIETNGIPETLRGDEKRLRQILYNLLSNAVKFTPDGGKIRVKADLVSDSKIGNLELQNEGKDSPAILISVRDTGIGIQKEDLERIFGAFEQVESSTSRKFQGTGLGLSLTRRLVELHRGRIWAESDGLGKGTTFRLVIPVGQNERKSMPSGEAF